MTDDLSPWPPHDAYGYIRSDQFGSNVLQVIKRIAPFYPSLDFADAASSLFTWLDKKVETDADFINGRRFPTEKAFGAYLRQASKNIAFLTARQRKRDGRILPLDEDFEPVSTDASPVQLAMLQDCIDGLPRDHRRIYELFVQDSIPEQFEGDRLPYITTILNGGGIDFREEDITRIYCEACDLLSDCLGR